MTTALLHKIAKTYKVNLEHFDHVGAFIDNSYTWLYIQFWEHEVIDGYVNRCNEKTIKMRVSAILKREEELPEDYVTNGYGEWLWRFK